MRLSASGARPSVDPRKVSVPSPRVTLLSGSAVTLDCVSLASHWRSCTPPWVVEAVGRQSICGRGEAHLLQPCGDGTSGLAAPLGDVTGLRVAAGVEELE